MHDVGQLMLFIPHQWHINCMLMRESDCVAEQDC